MVEVRILICLAVAKSPEEQYKINTKLINYIIQFNSFYFHINTNGSKQNYCDKTKEVKLLERSEIMNNINTSGMIWRGLK